MNGVVPESPSLTAVREWMLMVAPVAIYLFVERMFVKTHADVGYFCSAEWGIATVFIIIVTVQLLFLDMEPAANSRSIYNRGVASFLMFLMLMSALLALIFSAKILTMQGDAQSGNAVLWVSLQWLLLVLASLAYVWIKSLAISGKRR